MKKLIALFLILTVCAAFLFACKPSEDEGDEREPQSGEVTPEENGDENLGSGSGESENTGSENGDGKKDETETDAYEKNDKVDYVNGWTDK